MRLSPCLSVEVRDAPERCLLVLRGELDIAAVPALRALLAVLGRSPVVVDLAEVSFVDASGLAPLIEAKDEASREQRRFELRNPRPSTTRVLELLELLGLTGLVEPHLAFRALAG